MYPRIGTYLLTGGHTSDVLGLRVADLAFYRKTHRRPTAGTSPDQDGRRMAHGPKVTGPKSGIRPPVGAPSQYRFDLWWPYVEYCRSLLLDSGISMRTLDRALRQYSKENQT
jgi:hypothetical protein